MGPGLRGRRRVLRAGLVLAGASVLAGCSLLPLPGQQAARPPKIGFLAVGSREGRGFPIEGFLEGLREHGYTEGQNIVVACRFSDDRDDRLPGLAAELVALPVDLIVASGTPASFAARDATTTIPIVMGSVDKILKGANPGELPMEQPAKFDLVVNLKTAQTIGLAVPRSVLQQVTEVIQ